MEALGAHDLGLDLGAVGLEDGLVRLQDGHRDAVEEHLAHVHVEVGRRGRVEFGVGDGEVRAVAVDRGRALVKSWPEGSCRRRC